MQTLRQWLAPLPSVRSLSGAAAPSAGPFSLAMSSGFFGFFAHTGMLAALSAQGLRPHRVAGSSAGALVAGLWASGLEAEAIVNVLTTMTRDDFWDPGPGIGLLTGRKFDALLRRTMPVVTMEQTRVPVAISVFDILKRQTVALHHGDLPLAIRASCAVPAMFQPVRIAGRSYWDGGILDRPGLAGIPDGERVLFHHIVSRSPWRRLSPASVAIPKRPNMVTLAISNLPRSGPFALPAGQRALALARAATMRALDLPIVDGVVSCSA
jgi:NTE family protein